ncbi:MAG: peptidoglycan-binding protein [Actinomycetia bacterium]|nr:peptidoglycan-binding protein [Actinomycetes bacterium]
MHARGFFPVGTGQFGPNTLAMVKQLQRSNGLTPNGQIGPQTWKLAWTGKYRPAAPVKATAPKMPGGDRWFSYGDNSTVIKKWQQQMQKRGLFPVACTGQFGPQTLATVKHLQKANGLPANGLLGPVTWGLAWTGKY